MVVVHFHETVKVWFIRTQLDTELIHSTDTPQNYSNESDDSSPAWYTVRVVQSTSRHNYSSSVGEVSGGLEQDHVETFEVAESVQRQ